MRTDRLTAALEGLDPAGRALLELSLRQGVADETIAEMLDLRVEEVGERRRALLDRIAGQLGLRGGDAPARVEIAIATLPREERPEAAERAQPDHAGAEADAAEPAEPVSPEQAAGEDAAAQAEAAAEAAPEVPGGETVSARQGEPGETHAMRAGVERGPAEPAAPESADAGRGGAEEDAPPPEGDGLPVGVPVRLADIPRARLALAVLLPVLVFAAFAGGVIALAEGGGEPSGLAPAAEGGAAGR